MRHAILACSMISVVAFLFCRAAYASHAKNRTDRARTTGLTLASVALLGQIAAMVAFLTLHADWPGPVRIMLPVVALIIGTMSGLTMLHFIRHAPGPCAKDGGLG